MVKFLLWCASLVTFLASGVICFIYAPLAFWLYMLSLLFAVLWLFSLAVLPPHKEV